MHLTLRGTAVLLRLSPQIRAQTLMAGSLLAGSVPTVSRASWIRFVDPSTALGVPFGKAGLFAFVGGLATMTFALAVRRPENIVL